MSENQFDEEIAHLDPLGKQLSKEIAQALDMAKQAAIAYKEGKKVRTFDWNKAVEFLKTNHIKNADAGLIEDWSPTAAMILECGDCVCDSGAFLHSIWATPGMLVEYLDGHSEMIECWIYAEDAPWSCEAIWPKEALQEFRNKPHFVTDANGNKIDLW